MPRDNNGNFVLVAGNPVVTGTIIESNWANNTLNDVASEMTDSLSRTGQGGMLVPLLFTDGSVSQPGITWTSEPTTGFYRAGSNNMRATVAAVDVQRWVSGDSELWDGSDWSAIVTDKKLTPIVDQYLPLSGGTMTGDIFNVQGSFIIGSSAATAPRLVLNPNASDGHSILAAGSSTIAGNVELRPRGQGAVAFSLNVRPDGIITYKNSAGADQLIINNAASSAPRVYPLVNNTGILGVSTNQWSAVHAQNYYKDGLEFDDKYGRLATFNDWSAQQQIGGGIHAKGWFSGSGITGAGARMGVSSGVATYFGYDETNTAFLSNDFGRTSSPVTKLQGEDIAINVSVPTTGNVTVSGPIQGAAGGSFSGWVNANTGVGAGNAARIGVLSTGAVIFGFNRDTGAYTQINVGEYNGETPTVRVSAKTSMLFRIANTSALTITSAGASSDKPQGTAVNALTRKDYVDGKLTWTAMITVGHNTSNFSYTAAPAGATEVMVMFTSSAGNYVNTHVIPIVLWVNGLVMTSYGDRTPRQCIATRTSATAMTIASNSGWGVGAMYYR